jgi:hypothetical protein
MPRLTNAAICRQRGWQVGDIVEAQDETSAARFRITGIGEALVLVRQVGFCNFGWDWTRNEHDREMVAAFGFAAARKVEQDVPNGEESNDDNL